MAVAAMTGATLLLVCGVSGVLAPGSAGAAECIRLGPALVDHTCFHARLGPFAAVVAGTAARPTTDTLDTVHTYYRVALDAAAEPAAISYTPVRSGAWAFFVEHPVPAAVRDATGAELPAQHRDSVPGCAFLARVEVVALAAGTTYQLVLGPTSASEVGVVIENLDDFLVIHGSDRDGDGHGGPDAIAISACLPAPGYAASDDDCADDDPEIHPGASERCDGVDRNCNGIAGGDGDTCTIGVGRCAMAAVATCAAAGEPAVCSAAPSSPGTEICNGVDDDCDGVDDGDEVLCGDADRPRCVADGNAGRLCGCETDADCGGPGSGRLCSLRGGEQRCIDGCVDGFERNGCPPGLRCSSRDPARPGLCGGGAADASGGGCGTRPGGGGAVALLGVCLLVLRRYRGRRPHGHTLRYRSRRRFPMALKRTSTAVWRGDGPKGTGSITTLSGALKEAPYGFSTRFASEDGKAGTNPEELIAAAHASCFTMALAFQLTGAGKAPSELSTIATVTMEKQDIGWTIVGISLTTHGKVPGVTAAEFQELAETAKRGCPISRALAAVPSITLTATLDA